MGKKTAPRPCAHGGRFFENHFLKPSHTDQVASKNVSVWVEPLKLLQCLCQFLLYVRFGAGGMTSLSPNKTLIVKFEVLVICTVENNEASKKKEEDLDKAARGSIFKLSHSVTGL